MERRGPVAMITINRPQRRNAVDRVTARRLFEVFTAFNSDDRAQVAVLTGAGGSFCSGADLRAIADGDQNEVTDPGATAILNTPAPMGPTRLALGKPVIAAIEGFAVAGGLELAIWADLRVAARDAVLGVFCRRWGVPLVDGGTVRLPRLIGEGRAADLILTGRDVTAEEAHRIGLVDRLAGPGCALTEAVALAEQIAAHPQACMRSDRTSMRTSAAKPLAAALAAEVRLGVPVLEQGLAQSGAESFSRRPR